MFRLSFSNWDVDYSSSGLNLRVFLLFWSLKARPCEVDDLTLGGIEGTFLLSVP